MLGIHLIAIITTLLAVAIFGTWLLKLKQPANERLLALALLIAIPLQPLAFYCIRLPLDHWLVGLLGKQSDLYQWLRAFYAPLTEEPAKLVPLLIPVILRDINPKNFARYALAIGLGFALGEMWLLADMVSQSAAVKNLPFYQLTGYLVERLMTCLFHSVFVAVALWQLRRRFVLGVLGAMALHFLGNFPIVLMAWNIGGLGEPMWSGIVQLWLVLYFLGALALFSYFISGQFAPGKMIYGVRHCPECNMDYDASLLALNFGPRRYERCPHCQRWHWTGGRGG